MAKIANTPSIQKEKRKLTKLTESLKPPRMTKKIKKALCSLFINFLTPFVQEIINNRVRYWGKPKRAKIAPTAEMMNTLFNTASGFIEVGDYTFTGHNVSIITGTHRYESLMRERMTDVPNSDRDIKIGKGVWIGSNATILGPCKIGDHAVIAAGSVVLPETEIPPYTIWAGIPAKTIKIIPII